MSNSIAISISQVKWVLLTSLFLMSFFNSVMAVRNDIYQSNLIFTPEVTRSVGVV